DAAAADAREARVFADLDAPALVVGQVPVEGVEFVPGHPVECRFDELDGLEVAGRVEHQAAPGVGRGVVDGLCRDACHTFACGQQLPEGGCSVKETSTGGGLDLNAVGCDMKSVSLVGHTGFAKKADLYEVAADAARGGTAHHGKLQAPRPRDLVDEP